MKRQLGMRGIAYQENWRLVRGLDYYMRTTFEITAPGLGSQNAVCGGGRYDGWWNCWVGRPRQRESDSPSAPTGWCSRCRKRERARHRAALLVRELDLTCISRGLALRRIPRRWGWRGGCASGSCVEVPAVEVKFGKSLGLADRLEARYAVIVGDDELAARIVTVKRLSDGTQQKLAGGRIVFVFARVLVAQTSVCGV